MGGMQGFGSVVTRGSDRVADDDWELRVFAISTLVGIHGLGSGSGRAIREEMPPAEYLAAGYYERWLWSTERRLFRRGTVTEQDLESWVARLEAGEPPPRATDPEATCRALDATREEAGLRPARDGRFVPGNRVRVRRMRPLGHTRCPRYARGAVGLVEAVRGIDVFPDIGPYQGPEEPVYAVAFDSAELFGPSDEGSWTVALDLFESYLEPA